jgi:glycosyltransferase involved in cell wall biosynthesis
MSDAIPGALSVPRTLNGAAPERCFSADEMSRRLKVLFIVSQPHSSPTISVHATLMRFLDRDRVQVHAVYPRLAAEEPYRSSGSSVLDVLPRTPGVDLRPVELGPVGGIPRPEMLAAAARSALPAGRDIASLIRFIRRERIDVIHTEIGARNAFYGYLLSRVTPARYLVHFHSQYGDWMDRASKFAVHQAPAVITVSSWTGQGIARDGVPPERIFPVINGIDIDRWSPAASGDTVRRDLGLADDAPLIVQVAQLIDWKRQTMMIDAFREVVVRHPSARLMLVGSEQDPAGSYLAKLERRAADAGVLGHVTFAGRRRDVDLVLAAADIFALPSVGDPCALAHIEAMAMAKPVVGVQAAGAPELVVDGITGLLGPADDVPALAANLIRLIEDPARAREMGQAGRERAVEYLNARRMADEVEAVYRQMTGGPSVPAREPAHSATV